MTREEAVKVIENRDSIMDYCESAQLGEALDMAIKALEQEPCEDCISRQAVLDVTKRELFMGDAISEIEKLPPVTPTCSENPNNCEDAISREAVLDVTKREMFMDDAISEIEKLPPVTPKQKMGRWLYDRTRDWDGECKYECSECGMGSDVDYSYCMRCGAKMSENPTGSNEKSRLPEKEENVGPDKKS